MENFKRNGKKNTVFFFLLNIWGEAMDFNFILNTFYWFCFS